MSGWVVLLVGVVLCFLGVGSLQLALLASGFGVGWLLADLFSASTGVALVVAAGSAATCWLVVTVVFRAARFVVGVITGSVIGAKLYAIFSGDTRSVVLAVVVVVAVAVGCGFLADRFRGRVLLWATAIGGAGLMLSSLGVLWPRGLGFLRVPEPGWAQVTSTLLWTGLTVAGWFTQRRLFPSTLNLPPRPAQNNGRRTPRRA